jgi:hypothetical protein
LGLAAGENVYAYGPNVWNWADPLGLKCEDTSGTALIREYRPIHNQPHFTIETRHGGKSYTTEQYGMPGTPTSIANTDSYGAEGLGTTNTFKFDLPDANAAMKHQKQLVKESMERSRKGISGPQYDVDTQSCLTHCFDVLRAGGENAPKTSERTVSLFRYMKGHIVK